MIDSEWVTDTGKRCPSHHVLMKIKFDAQDKPLLTPGGRVVVGCTHCDLQDSISLSSARKEPYRWSTDRTCISCKGPVDALLDGPKGSTIAAPDDQAKVQAVCRRCGRPHSVRMVELHVDNQFEA